MRRKTLETIEQALKLLAFALFGVVLVAIVVAKLYVPQSPSTTSPNGETVDVSKDYYLFGDLGRLRLKTKDKNDIFVILKPYLQAPENDPSFEEELVQKKQLLRDEFTRWFATHSIDEIKAMGEDRIKQSLLEQLNTHLVMGTVKQLYFDEYMILD